MSLKETYIVSASYGDKLVVVEIAGYEAASEYAQTLLSEAKDGNVYGKVYVAVHSNKGRVWSYEIEREIKQ